MQADEEFQRRARDLLLELRAEHQLTYKELAQLLERHGVTTDWKALANRLQRGTFDAGFMLAVLHAFGIHQVAFTRSSARLKTSK
ncbi:DUF6471 domain-containing protein [Roseateles sp.]|uniref:DUF6471 domain-containing protein n=1 Tax=Roseateles sp. TaxID=1971397 RepID=UPI0025DA8774|nr:DUF6471 domain-containing protein [Roseateles sp.]MBV8037351.1 hypothetical protein [Roseateles sp.]